MPDYTKDLATAAEWIWQHRDEPQYWEWHDLTAHNPAPDTLNMPDTIAWNIFTILQERELMLPFELEKDEKIIHAFNFNLNNEKAWAKIRKQPTACL
ncbi:MAG: hypothetical protein CME32_27195 [Gimesia sp.]|nr:hypothetical protein [Gimesia sp.]